VPNQIYAEMKVSKYIRQILALIILAIFVAYFIANKEKFRILLHMNFWLLILVASCYVVSIISNGIFTKFILEPFRKYISVVESFYVSLISSVGNFFAPAGVGFAFRAVYLKQKHGLQYSDYISTLSGNYILVFLINSIIALFSLAMLRNSSSARFETLVIIFGLMFIVSLILCFIKIPRSAEDKLQNMHLKKVGNILVRIIKGWSMITAHKNLMIRLAGLTVFNAGLSLAIIWLIITSLHLSASFPALLLFSVLGTLSLFINITPANLGVKEAIYLFSSTILGFSTTQILSIALIDRGVQFMVLLILWLLFSKYRGVPKKYYPQK
jgi:uncharacterized protein (TIRG00374 family)